MAKSEPCRLALYFALIIICRDDK